MNIQELRQMTDTVDEYKRFYNFEKWVLKEPLSEITSHTTLNVTYKKLLKVPIIPTFSTISETRSLHKRIFW